MPGAGFEPALNFLMVVYPSSQQNFPPNSSFVFPPMTASPQRFQRDVCLLAMFTFLHVIDIHKRNISRKKSKKVKFGMKKSYFLFVSLVSLSNITVLFSLKKVGSEKGS